MGEKLAKMISECDLFFKRSLKQGEDNLKGYESNLAKAISLKTTFPLFLDDGKDIPNNKGKVWPRDYYPDKPSFVTFGDFFSWAFDKNTGTRRYTYADMGEPEKFFVDPVTRKDYYTKDTFIYRIPKFVNMSGYFIHDLNLDEPNISEMNNIAYLFEYLSYDAVRKHKNYLKAVEIGADKFSNIVLNKILSNISKDFIKTKWDKFYPDKYWNSGFGDVDNNGNIIGKDYGIIDIIGREYPILPEIYGDDSWFWIENPWYRRGEIVFEALIEKINETDNVQSVAVTSPAPVQETVQKIRMHLVGFDDNFQIKAKQDLPDFKIYVGDIPIADDPNKSSDYDDFVEVLDDEYREIEYGGQEEEEEVYNAAENREIQKEIVKIESEPYVPDTKHVLDMVPGYFVTNSGAKIQVCQIDSKPVPVKIAGPYLDMRAAAAKDGVKLSINSAFRSPYDSIKGKSNSGVAISASSQKSLYDSYLAGTGNLAAKPGSSNHGNGIGLDLNTGSRKSNKNGPLDDKVYKWLVKNSWRFGFVRAVASEEWHFDYLPDLIKQKETGKAYAKLANTESNRFYSDLGLNNVG